MRNLGWPPTTVTGCLFSSLARSWKEWHCKTACDGLPSWEMDGWSEMTWWCSNMYVVMWTGVAPDKGNRYLPNWKGEWTIWWQVVRWQTFLNIGQCTVFTYLDIKRIGIMDQWMISDPGNGDWENLQALGKSCRQYHLRTCIPASRFSGFRKLLKKYPT